MPRKLPLDTVKGRDYDIAWDDQYFKVNEQTGDLEALTFFGKDLPLLIGKQAYLAATDEMAVVDRVDTYMIEFAKDYPQSEPAGRDILRQIMLEKARIGRENEVTHQFEAPIRELEAYADGFATPSEEQLNLFEQAS